MSARPRVRGLERAFVVFAWSAMLSCECEPPRRAASAGSEFATPVQPAAVVVPVAAQQYEAAEDAAAPAPLQRPVLPAAVEPETVALASDALDATSALGAVAAPFVIDALVDVAAAGPAVATARGVVLLDRENRLSLARLAEPPANGARPRATPLAELPEGAGPFQLARGPVERGGVAYWVSRGQLLGEPIGSALLGAPAQVLTNDARVGTRAAVPVGVREWTEKLPRLVAYIARPTGPDDPARAKLWVEGRAEPVNLNDDLSSAHSVALAATPEGLVALFLEARTGMSSIHQRTLRFPTPTEPSLGPDRIIWVGGPSRPSTELVARGADTSHVTALLALERDATHFGLIQLDAPLLETAPLELSWLLYENGLEPSPFAALRLCGRDVIALARPSSAAPSAPQELALIDMSLEQPQVAAIVARSKAFFEISLASAGRGALLVYVADHRTWARTLHCTAG
jgi:hypothetical protein